MDGIDRLHDIMVRLRDPEKGCPWDRVQTLETLKPCVLEEAYELLAAMDNPGDRDNHVEELGDVLLQVMFQAVMAEQEGRFTFDDVANAVSDKLVRRHPHVFGDVDAKDPAAVLKNWERIKKVEHRKEKRHSALDGVPPTLPALLKAQRVQEKAGRNGFEVDDARIESRTKEEEVGNMLFAACKLARRLKVDAESALAAATERFAAQFRKWEQKAKRRVKAAK